MTLQKSLEVLGVTVEPTVFLIGRLREGGSGYPLCVEPEDGPIVPADFDGLRDRATELYHQDPTASCQSAPRGYAKSGSRQPCTAPTAPPSVRC
jgi:hypothetical protein